MGRCCEGWSRDGCQSEDRLRTGRSINIDAEHLGPRYSLILSSANRRYDPKEKTTIHKPTFYLSLILEWTHLRPSSDEMRTEVRYEGKGRPVHGWRDSWRPGTSWLRTLCSPISLSIREGDSGPILRMRIGLDKQAQSFSLYQPVPSLCRVYR